MHIVAHTAWLIIVGFRFASGEYIFTPLILSCIVLDVAVIESVWFDG